MNTAALARFWRMITGQSKVQRKALPGTVAPSKRVDPVKLANLGGTLKTLNDEFATLNDKLFELKDALQNLKEALKTLEAAKARRADQNRLFMARRVDNTLN